MGRVDKGWWCFVIYTYIYYIFIIHYISYCIIYFISYLHIIYYILYMWNQLRKHLMRNLTVYPWTCWDESCHWQSGFTEYKWELYWSGLLREQEIKQREESKVLFEKFYSNWITEKCSDTRGEYMFKEFVYKSLNDRK